MKLTRRAFIATSLTGAVALLAACGGSTAPASPVGSSAAASAGSASAPVAPRSGSAPPTSVAAVSTNPSVSAAASGVTLESTINYVTNNLTPTLDPHQTLSSSQFQAARLFHEALVQLDKDNKVQPMLAASWKQIDATTLQFKLRDDVTFHNGDKFTAKDVKANVERLISSNDPLHSGTKLRLLAVKGADVVDDYTVNILTKEPSATLLRTMTMFFINNPKQFAANDKTILTAAIGTGPFAVKEFVRDNHFTASAVGNWRVKPRFQTLKASLISDPAPALAALKAGDADVMDQIPFDQAANMKDSGFQIFSSTIGAIKVYDLDAVHDTPLKDVRIRQAANYAVDRAAILKNTQAGFGRVSDAQMVGPEAFGYNPNIKAIPYDPDKAKQLLQQAGAKLPITVNCGMVASVKPFGEAMAGFLNKVGFQVNIHILEFGAFSQLNQNGPRDPMWSWRGDYWQTNDASLALSSFSKVGRPQTAWRLDSQEFEDTFAASERELDESKRLALLQKASQIVYDAMPVLFMPQWAFVNAASSKLQGLRIAYDTTIPFEEVTKTK